MKSVAQVGLPLLLALTSPLSAAAVSVHSPHAAARHKSGPVTMRGIAQHVTSRSFTLQTNKHGSFAVDAMFPTHVVEKGQSGRVTVAEGNHVGVRGYVKGRTIRAIQVRIYPVAPKPVSVRGTITQITGLRLTVRSGGGLLTILLTSNTVIRTSSALLKPSDLRLGDRIEARIVTSGHNRTALHIHVYRTRAPQTRVRLSGTIRTANVHGAVIVQSGIAHSITFTASTRFYVGTSRAPTQLRAGQQVTVYACCAGQALVATSIHVRLAHTVSHSVALRGNVISIAATSLRLNTAHAPLVQLGASTVYEIGSTRITRNGIHTGDLISVRGHEHRGVFQATRVHVYQASRHVTTIRGIISGVSGSSVRMAGRGSTYTVAIGRTTVIRLAGGTIRLSQVKAGDRARAVGHVSGHRLQASSIDLTSPAMKIITVRGTVTSGGASWLEVAHSSGARDTVRLSGRTRVVFAGRPTTGDHLFPGSRVVVRGTRTATGLHASTVTATARSKSEMGRVTSIAARVMVLERSPGKAVRIDLPAGVSPRDGSHAVSLGQIGRGAYVRVSGYEELSKAIRATAVTVRHLKLTLRAVLIWHGRVAWLKTSTGESYLILFGTSSAVTVAHVESPLQPTDLPTGTSVHAVGTVGITGSLAVLTLSARLHSETIRGKVESIKADALVLGVSDNSVRVRLLPSTTMFQGSRPLRVADLVLGDDVSAYGYEVKGGAMVARKLSIHRRLLGLNGIVASVTDHVFVLTAADGPHTVVVSSTTSVIGPAGVVLASGMKVHVTGYLRGDGTVLATRLHILKVPSPKVSSP